MEMTKDIGVVVLLRPLLGIKLKRLLQVSENMLLQKAFKKGRWSGQKRTDSVLKGTA